MHYFSKKHTLLFSFLLNSCVIIAMDQTPEQLLKTIQRSPDISHIDQSLLKKRNSEGENVFHVACKQGDIESITKIFHRKNKNDIENIQFTPDRYGYLGIHKAAENGKAIVIAMLLNTCEKKNSNPALLITCRNNGSGSTPLHCAAKNGHYTATKTLIDASVRYNILKEYLFMEKHSHYTALHLAIGNNHPNIVEIILKTADDLAPELASISDSCGLTAIHRAISHPFNPKKNDQNVLKICVKMIGYNILHLRTVPCSTTVIDYGKIKNPSCINALLKSLKSKCTLCLDTKRCTRLYTMSNCNGQSGCKAHFCKRCLRELIATHLNEGSTRELKCPNFNCAKKINASDVCNITQGRKDLYTRFLDISFDEFKIDNQNHIKFCPTPDCKCTYSTEEVAAAQQIQCPSCNHTYCVTCQYDHDNTTCEYAATLDHDCVSCATRHARNMTCQVAARDRAKIESSLQELQSIQIKPCPHCKVFIEKNQGCNHITCKKCSHEFCWTCLSAFRTTRCNSSWCDVLKVETGINF